MLVNALHQDGSELLSQKEPAHQEEIGIPSKSDSTENPQGNDKGDGNMDGKEPLCREPFDICSPVPEGDIQNKYQDRNGYQMAHATFKDNKHSHSEG